MSLAEQPCTACDSRAKPLSDVAIAQFLAECPGWVLNASDGIKKITKVYDTGDFSSAIALANAIATIADKANHHPSIIVEWGQLTVSWWTHSVQGLHKNDFIMAAKTDLQLNQILKNQTELR